MASHTPSIAVLAKSIGRFSRSLPGESGMRKVLSPSAFSSLSVRRAPSASHQLMRPTP